MKKAKLALFYQLTKKDWRDIRWTDECYCAIRPEGRIQIIRKLGERLYPNCIHHSLSYQQLDILVSRYGDAACLWLQLDVEGLRCSALTAQRSTFCGVYALRPLVP